MFKAQLSIFAIIFLISCSVEKNKVFHLQGKTMGTTYNVKFVAPKEYDSRPIKSLIDQRLVEVNKAMSTYISDSEISTFNSLDANSHFQISNDFKIVLSHALELAKKTNGVFDPTIGPLVNLWGFGPRGQRIVPKKEAIERTKKMVGFDKVILKGSNLTKKVDGVYLDLSASAKGYGVDAILKLLKRRGLNNAMVEIGGEVRTSGYSIGRPWKLGIETPAVENYNGNFVMAIEMFDSAMATSGDYRNFFKSDGKRYSHTIDYRTGRPVESGLASVSVISKSCMDADALATALMAMGTSSGLKWAEANNVKAFFIYREHGSEKFEHKMTKEFKKVIR